MKAWFWIIYSALGAIAIAAILTKALASTSPLSHPTPTPSPSPSPLHLVGHAWAFEVTDKQRAETCVGVSVSNPHLTRRQVRGLLADPWLNGEGRMLCAFFQPDCKTECVPVKVNGISK